MNEVIFPEPFKIYKKNQQGTGGALDLSVSKIGLFLTIAKQAPNPQKPFDWDNAPAILKLDLVDIGKILQVFRAKDKLSIFHDAGKFYGTPPRQRGLNIEYNAQYNSFYWSIWKKENEQTSSAGVIVTAGETLVIESLLNFVIPRMLRWEQTDFPPRDRETKSGLPTRTAREETTFDDRSDIPFSDEPFPTEQRTPSNQSTPAPVPGALRSLTKDEKIQKIIDIAMAKLGATPDNARLKVMEVTGVPFTDANTDAIFAAMLMLK